MNFKIDYSLFILFISLINMSETLLKCPTFHGIKVILNLAAHETTPLIYKKINIDWYCELQHHLKRHVWNLRKDLNFFKNSMEIIKKNIFMAKIIWTVFLQILVQSVKDFERLWILMSWEAKTSFQRFNTIW